MGTVQAQAIMSLDGYVAKQDNTIGRLFDWLQNGELALPTPAGDFTVHLSKPSAEHWRRWTSSLGALVCDPTLFDVTEGWQGRHTLDVPVVVVTHAGRGCRHLLGQARQASGHRLSWFVSCSRYSGGPAWANHSQSSAAWIGNQARTAARSAP